MSWYLCSTCNLCQLGFQSLAKFTHIKLLSIGSVLNSQYSPFLSKNYNNWKLLWNRTDLQLTNIGEVPTSCDAKNDIVTLLYLEKYLAHSRGQSDDIFKICWWQYCQYLLMTISPTSVDDNIPNICWCSILLSPTLIFDLHTHLKWVFHLSSYKEKYKSLKQTRKPWRCSACKIFHWRWMLDNICHIWFLDVAWWLKLLSFVKTTLTQWKNVLLALLVCYFLGTCAERSQLNFYLLGHRIGCCA